MELQIKDQTDTEIRFHVSIEDSMVESAASENDRSKRTYERAIGLARFAVADCKLLSEELIRVRQENKQLREIIGAVGRRESNLQR